VKEERLRIVRLSSSSEPVIVTIFPANSLTASPEMSPGESLGTSRINRRMFI
jgi:hypothetical protein